MMSQYRLFFFFCGLFTVRDVFVRQNIMALTQECGRGRRGECTAIVIHSRTPPVSACRLFSQCIIVICCFFLILPLQKHTCHCVCLCEYICVNVVRVCVCPTRSNTNNLLLKMQMDSICGPLLSVSGWAFWGKFLCMQLCGRCVIRRNVSVYACTQTRCQLYLMHLFNTVFVCCDSADSKKDICVLSGCACARERTLQFHSGFWGGVFLVAELMFSEQSFSSFVHM